MREVRFLLHALKKPSFILGASLPTVEVSSWELLRLAGFLDLCCVAPGRAGSHGHPSGANGLGGVKWGDWGVSLGKGFKPTVVLVGWTDR